VIQAITNQQVGLNVITELIIGYALPGRPIAMMLFKTWGYITMSQALQFTSDLKLGHYMKIPHRPMFWCQIVATVVAGTVQLGVQAWMFTNIEDLCSADQPNGFTCPSTTVFGTASIIVSYCRLFVVVSFAQGCLSQWGVIGPKRLFSHGQLYYGLVFFFLAGAIAPIIQWTLHKKFRLNFLKYVNFPLIFTGTGNLPPATPLNYVPWVLVCYFFNNFIRRRHFNWWTKYNCKYPFLRFVKTPMVFFFDTCLG
jgi:OPT oligopeptide transporter protein